MGVPACFITRVKLRNFKSIATCDVALRPLTFLVGPNGSGKSNFVDSLRLVRDGLRFSLDHAMRERGGVKEIRRRSAGHPTHFEIDLTFRLEAGREGRYRFKIGAPALGEYEVQSEALEVDTADSLSRAFFEVRRGEVTGSSAETPPAAASDRLYLVNASGLPEFRPVYDALSRMGFYNLNPDRIRELQDPDSGELLSRDGSNLAAVYKRLSHDDKARASRVEEYLARVVPGVSGVEAKSLGPKETWSSDRRSPAPPTHGDSRPPVSPTARYARWACSWRCSSSRATGAGARAPPWLGSRSPRRPCTLPPQESCWARSVRRVRRRRCW